VNIQLTLLFFLSGSLDLLSELPRLLSKSTGGLIPRAEVGVVTVPICGSVSLSGLTRLQCLGLTLGPSLSTLSAEKRARSGAEPPGLEVVEGGERGEGQSRSEYEPHSSPLPVGDS